MDSVLRAIAVYLILLTLFRLSGKRTIAQITTIDLVLLLIVSEATQQAMLGDDYSVINAALIITTLMLVDRVADVLKYHSRRFSQFFEGVPLVLVAQGQPLERHLRKEHISIDDILVAARKNQGLLHLEDIEYAILERSGGISIIPKASDEAETGRADRADPG